jgi:hypothetical protein
MCVFDKPGLPQKMQSRCPFANGTPGRFLAMTPKPHADEQQRDELLRRALATPPISNEEIIRRSKQAPRKR